MKYNKTVYLAGPMRGYDQFNFPAFDRYQKYLESVGYKVISPASLDREAGFNPNTDNVTPDMMRQMILRDCEAICNKAEMVFLMPEWENSSGVKVELALADFLELPVEELGWL